MDKNKKAVGICSIVAIVAIGVLVLTSGVVSAATRVVNQTSPSCVLGDYYHNTIQAAINAAAGGDEIIVCPATYTENVLVNKSLTIRSLYGAAVTTVQAAITSHHVFNVTADYVNISGFNVTGSTDFKTGIYLDNVTNCNISDNNVGANDYGIYLLYSSNNTIADNTASDNAIGILLVSSSDNTLTGNANSNSGYGIFLSSSSNNNLTNNTASNNTYGCISLSSSSNNNLAGNIASYGDGIDLWGSSNNTLAGNVVLYTNIGIDLYYASNNTLAGNVASYNFLGINLYSSNNNSIYNNYFSNTQNAKDNGNNVWNISKTPGTNIIGGSWLGGNYLSDYTGNDTDSDGLGDTPYDIPGGANKDYLPLVAIAAPEIFDTGKGEYPSIAGTHNGTIKLNYTITVFKLYTYLCPGTGGHTESVKIWNSTSWNVTATWNGYVGDWHNITFNNSFTLYANETYNYTIKTGSYPQIIHEPSWNATGGVITCEEFVDVNGKRHVGWIPAIRLS